MVIRPRVAAMAFVLAWCVGGSAFAEKTYEVASQNELTAALTVAASAQEAVVIKLSGVITPLSQITLMNKSSTEPISFVGPATLKEKPIVIYATTPIVFRQITIEGKVTIGSGKVTFIDCTLNQAVEKNGGEVVYENDTSEATAFPEDLIIAASSQRQVYFGFPMLKGVAEVKAQVLKGENEWLDLDEQELIVRDERSAEPTVVGWRSIRYLGATSGSTAFYRLQATTAKGETFASKVVEVKTAPAGKLHSRPNAKATIYLDFDGYIDDYSGNAAAARKNYIATPVYQRREEIEKIWRSVAEDFLVFDVDVTTEEPPIDRLVKSNASDDKYGKRVVFDPRTGLDKWYVGAGGVSGLGAFGFRTDRPAFIFGETTDNVACQATHEVAHTLGLVHDGGKILIPAGSLEYVNGKWIEVTEEYTIESEYFTGQRISLNCTWYPVMGGVPTNDGADYLNQFSNGNYESATNDEDDFAVITGEISGAREGNVVVFPEELYPDGKENGFWKLRLVADEVGNDLACATPYAKTIAGLISPCDVDVYSFAAAKGVATIRVSPEYRGSSYGCSLDAKVELLDATGKVLCESIDPLQGNIDDGEFRKAELEYEIPSDGIYYVRVSGTFHETRASMTTAYGSVGPYVLTIAVCGRSLRTPKVLFR